MLYIANVLLSNIFYMLNRLSHKALGGVMIHDGTSVRVSVRACQPVHIEIMISQMYIRKLQIKLTARADQGQQRQASLRQQSRWSTKQSSC